MPGDPHGLYVCASLNHAGRLPGERLARAQEGSERIADLRPDDLFPVGDLADLSRNDDYAFLVVELSRYAIGRSHLRLIRDALQRGRKVHVCWLGEEMLEEFRPSLGRGLRLAWLRQALGRRISGLPPSILYPYRPEEGTASRPGSAQPVDPSEADTVVQHFAGAVTDLAANLGGIGATRETSRHASAIAEQLTRDMPAAVERIRLSGNNPKTSIDMTELDLRLAEIDALKQSVAQVDEALGVIARVLDSHAAYLSTGVDMLQSITARMMTQGSVFGGRIHQGSVPDLVGRFRKLAASAQPASAPASRDREIRFDAGLYFRFDYWAPGSSGGSYGHTCYVCKELDRLTDRFTVVTANPFTLLDEFGVHSVRVKAPFLEASDLHILNAGQAYETLLSPLVQTARPDFIYERLCLGNIAGALAARSQAIPYIVEYNGSELSLRRSFDGSSFEQEEAFLAAEAFAFAQATCINVVSAHIRDDLVERGVDAGKILVNPNCVDPEDYAPAEPGERAAIRRELGLREDAVVAGFIGTFGGWHGIDVLAAALKPILDQAPDLQFLLIGDGNFAHLVDDQIAEHGLQQRVIRTGQLPQRAGLRALKACDLYLSPHSSHMVDRPFFGSPTKLFEYMAMAGGIVASDLEQIGEVLKPAFTAAEIHAGTVTVGKQRAVLCRPGDVADFVNGVVGLARQPGAARAMGANARDAAIRHYSWREHVLNIFRFMADEPVRGYADDMESKSKAPAL